jgi:hypothetical protein
VNRSRLYLLGGQTTALGVMVAFLVVPASALFLDRYGAGVLPWAYLAVAASGIVVSAVMKRAQRHLSLAGVAVAVLLGYLALVATGYVLLAAADAAWVTFPLLVMFPLMIPIGFVLVGSQAGRLLDVRQMKAHLPRVFAGFSVGFALGGLGAAVLVGVVGGPVRLLAVDVLAAGVFLALVVVTARRFPAELRARPEPAPAIEAPEARAALRSPLVRSVFAYQVLSAATTQLLDFMVWERAAARYPDPSDLARFQGLFGAVINVTAVLFVGLLAGRLLTRWGIALGLAANPAGVMVLMVAGTAIGYLGGPATTLFFFVVCTQQVVDISLTDGTTRTSINATYQALPARERLGAQTRVEAAGVPVALGLVGTFLLVHQALDLDVRVIAVVTLVLSVLWLWIAIVAHRHYAADLSSLLARRPWVPRSLRIRDDAQRAAVQRLLASSDPVAVDVARSALAESHTMVAPSLVRYGDPAAATGASDGATSGDELRTVLLAEAARIAWLLDADGTLDDHPDTAALSRAMRDEVAASGDQAVAALGLAHGVDAMTRAWRALGHGGDADRALALEFLEVSLGRETADLVATLADGRLDDATRRDHLAKHTPVRAPALPGCLVELVTDPDGRWQEPWLRVCALYAAPAAIGADAAAELAAPWLGDPDQAVAETALRASGPSPTTT